MQPAPLLRSVSSVAMPCVDDTRETCSLVEALPHIVWLKDPDGATVWMNRRGEEWFGLPRSEIYGWMWLDHLHPDDVGATREAWVEAVATGGPYDVEYRLRRPDGTYRWMSSRGSAVVGPDGQVERWTGTLTDIDERVRLEQGLRESRGELAATLTLLESIQATAPVGLAFIDREFRKVRVNEMLASATGIPVEEQLGRTVADVVPEMWPELEPIYRKVLETGEPLLNLETSTPPTGGNGRTRHWLTSYYPVSVGGEITGIGLVLVDVTEQKEADADRRFKARLLEAAGEAIVAVDLDGRIAYANPAAERIYGYEPGELVGRPGYELIPPEERNGRTDALMGEVRRGHPWSGEFLAQRRDGTRFPISITDTPVFDESGSVVALIGVSSDITERTRSEQFRRAVMENMAEGLYAVDRKGALLYMNRAAGRMLGWREEELQGRSMHSAVHFQQPDGTFVSEDDCPLRRALVEGLTVRRDEETFTRKDGSMFPVAFSSAPIRVGGETQGMVVVFRDVTEESERKARVDRELAVLSWVGRIRDALDEDRFVLHSQPIVPVGEGRPSEELLLRMVMPSGEIIAPGAFLPVAEKYGLISEVDRWVVRQAARRAAGGRRVELNLSAASVGAPGLLGFIKQEISASGADPADLVFEITETALMNDIDLGESFLRGLSDLGCGIALDDFGTGFGSFTYLRRLPVDYLKIDVEFTRELAANPANGHVIRAVVSLAKAFGLQTIAEGVEDEETLELLRRDGVDMVQGYLLGRPAPLDGP